jgi:hypothetical protein
MQGFKFIPTEMEFRTARDRLVVARSIGSRVIVQVRIAAGLQDCATFRDVAEFERAFIAARLPEPERVGAWRGTWGFEQFISAALNHRFRPQLTSVPVPEAVELDDADVVLEGGGGHYTESRRREVVAAATAGEERYGSLGAWWTAEGRHLGPSRTTVYRWVARRQDTRPVLTLLRGGVA